MGRMFWEKSMGMVEFFELETGFSDAWHFLQNDSRVDSVGGAQFERVHEEWIDAGRPESARDFILARANVILS